MENPTTIFIDKQPVDYSSVAKIVANIQPRALTENQYEDVITLIEWMKEQCVASHTANIQHAKELDIRALEIERREKELRARSRAVGVAGSMIPQKRFLKYFRG